MTEFGRYVEMLMSSLEKKVLILDKIMDANQRLEEVITVSEMDMEQFKAILDEKDGYVTEIQKMDEGFQLVFDKIKEQLDDNKQDYKEEVLRMQQLIRQIADKVVVIQEEEAKSRLTIESQFAKMKKNIHVAKKGMNVAQNYYKTMSKTNIIDSQFLDKKN